MTIKEIKILERYPIGTKVRYNNPGKRGDGGEAEVSDHFISYQSGKMKLIGLSWGMRRTTVSINQINKYYIKTNDKEKQPNQ